MLQNYNYFNAVTTDRSQKDYIFENNSSDAATSMYFEYTVELSDDYKTNADFEDGTFYRYNKVIYSRIQDIIDAYKDQKAIFNGQTKDAVVDELKAAKMTQQIQRLSWMNSARSMISRSSTLVRHTMFRRLRISISV